MLYNILQEMITSSNSPLNLIPTPSEQARVDEQVE